MCNAYADIVLFVYIYRICSRCLILVVLPVWPTYDLLHVLHCNLYIQLEFILFCGALSHSWLYAVLHALNATFELVLLNRLATLCMSGIWYVNVLHFFLCVCMGVFVVSWLVYKIITNARYMYWNNSYSMLRAAGSTNWTQTHIGLSTAATVVRTGLWPVAYLFLSVFKGIITWSFYLFPISPNRAKYFDN